jgi:hypothetical protein
MQGIINQQGELRALAKIPTSCQMSLLRYGLDGSLLLAAGRDGRIHRWRLPPVGLPLPAADAKSPDAGESAELPPLVGHNGWISSLEISADGQWLLSADTWGRLACWPLTATAERPHWEHTEAHAGWLRALAVTRDGSCLASCGADGMVRLWNPADGSLLRQFSGGGQDLYSLACHPDGQRLAVGDLRGGIHVFDLRDGKHLTTWDAAEFYKLSYIQEVGGVRWVAWNGNGTVLAAAGCIPENGGFVQGIPALRFFNTADGSVLQQLKLGDNQEGFVHQVLWHSEDYWMGVCSGQPGRGRFFLHRTADEAPFCLNPQPLANCHSAALHPLGRQVAVLANEGTYGQQKSMAKDGIYPGNTSPIHVFELPASGPVS